jgi:TorA maturation chaperone TorD
MTRGTLYRVLSRGFSLEIDEAYLEWIVLLNPTIKQLAVHVDSKDFKKGSERLDAFTERVKLDYEKDKAIFLQNLAAEYASLFLNVGPKPVHLVESVYLGKEPLLYEEPYFDVVRIYQLYGFKKRASFKEPEDHIGVELEFMAHLCDLACASLEQGKKDFGSGYMNNQVEFLDLHLSKWTQKLAEKLRWATRNDFYLALADLLSGFVSTDRATAEQFSKELTR